MQLVLYNGFKTAVIIPFRNEATHVAGVIEGIPDFIDFIVAVDDASTDEGPRVVTSLRDPRLVRCSNPSRLGVGGSIMKGHLIAKKAGSQVNVVMAGDGQMDPKYLPKLLDMITEFGLDYAKGNRFMKPRHTGGMPMIRIVVNRTLGLLTKFASGYWYISDPQNGYTALRTSLLDRMDVKHIWRGYQFENDMLIRLNVVDAKVCDIPIPARYENEKSSIRSPFFTLFTSVFLLQRGFWRLRQKARSVPQTPCSELYPHSYWDLVEVDGTAASKAVLKWLDARQGDRILDIGCGTGRFMEVIEKAGAQAVGIEPFAFPLRQARKRGVRGELHQMLAEKMPFPNASFDKILCYHVIEHLEHPYLAFDEMHRILKEKGRMVLAFPNSNYLLFKLGIVKQSPQHLQRFTASFKPPRFTILKRRVFRLGFNVVMLLERMP